MLDEQGRRHLSRAVDLAEQALASGDEPFGSVLVAGDGEVLFEDHNHVAGGDHTRQPEFEIARWAAANLSPEQRAAAVVYTSGEHCPMCSGAHGMVGLGAIYYASSSAQLTQWRSELGLPAGRVAPLPIQQVIPDAQVWGPDPELSERVRELHARRV